MHNNPLYVGLCFYSHEIYWSLRFIRHLHQISTDKMYSLGDDFHKDVLMEILKNGDVTNI